MSRSNGKRRRKLRPMGEDVDPMNYVSNMSDVMLILAVGIMVALILHWNVDIVPPDQNIAEQETSDNIDTITFDENDLEDKEELPEDAERMGNVYYDPKTGTYYIIKDPEE